MFRKSGLLGAALAMFIVAGGHWSVLQSVAWVQMVCAYTQETGSVATGIEQTFDGQHPCPLCKKIETAKAHEHKGTLAAETAGKDLKAKALLSAPILPLDERAVIGLLAATVSPRWDCRAIAPPTPPPRSGDLAV